MKYVVTHGDRELELELEVRDDGRYDVHVGDRVVLADLHPAGGQSLFSLLLGEAAYEVSVVRNSDQTRVTARGRDIPLTVESEQERNARLVEGAGGGTRAHTVKSSMPGRVARVLVEEGEEVEAGAALVILEAMKMENEIRAAAGGRIARILVSDGQTVGNGEPLVVIE